ncbi:MAG: hypothetical protein IJL37_09110 [Bacteroidaceae bacterium]|nr:hypothetical protein [Bacteroidaceae bacterium]
MKTDFLLLSLLIALTFFGCSSNDDPTSNVEEQTKMIIATRGNGSLDLEFSFDDGVLVVTNANIPSLSVFNEQIDGHAWRMLSQGFILADGSIRDNNKGNMTEYFVLLNQRRLAILSNPSFGIAQQVNYGDFVEYNEKTGFIGLFNVMKLSPDYKQMITIAETYWYPDPSGKAVKGYSIAIYERLSDNEKAQVIARYRVDMNQLVAEPIFEPSNGKDIFGANISDLSYDYMDPGFAIRVNGLKQISESVFNKYIKGYGWKYESAHQIEPNGKVNPKEYEFIQGLEEKKHYYFGKDKYQVFSTSYWHDNTPWFYEEKYVYHENTNTFFEINDGQEVAGKRIICFGNEMKSFYIIEMNHQNHFSSNSHDFRFNLVKYTRMTDKELKEIREKHHTNYWDLDWNAAANK